MPRHLYAFLVAILILAAVAPPVAHAANPYSSGVAKLQRRKSNLTAGWHFLRTDNPQGPADVVSIMHTADTSRSDLDFVGLMIRCGAEGPQTVLVTLRPFSFRDRPRVTIATSEEATQFVARVVPPGTAILLPSNATAKLLQLNEAKKDLVVRIDQDKTTIRGTVVLIGLKPAYDMLLTRCPVQ